MGIDRSESGTVPGLWTECLSPACGTTLKAAAESLGSGAWIVEINHEGWAFESCVNPPAPNPLPHLSPPPREEAATTYSCHP